MSDDATSSVNNYLIDQTYIDWATILRAWSWLLPPDFTLWLVNRFADLFLVLPDDSVYMLDVGVGSLKRMAGSRDNFRARIDEDENGNDWLMIPLVDELVAAGMTLPPGYCYGFKTPPVLGGQYAVQNVGPLPIRDYLGGYGSIHEQLRDVPDGAEVVLNIAGKPSGQGQAAAEEGRV